MKLFVVSTALDESRAYARMKQLLAEAGHTVLEPPDASHTWSYIAKNYGHWDPLEYRTNINSEAVVAHFNEVLAVMEAAEGCILLQPASPAAHLVAGWFAGQGKPLFVTLLYPDEPNLMHLLADRITFGASDLGEALNDVAEERNSGDS